MKRLMLVATLGAFIALPNVSEAHGFYGHHGGGYYGHGGGYGGHGYVYGGRGYGYGYVGPGNLIGDALALPFVAAAAVVGAVATVATAPLYAGSYAAPPAPVYGPPQAYYPQTYVQPGYYAPPPRAYYPQVYPQGYGYAPPPGY